jgi:heme A synthase
MITPGEPARRHRFTGLIAPAAILVAAAIAFAAGPAGPDHRRAVFFAAAVCLAGAVGAWFVGQWPATTPSGRVTASLGATALRLFPALLALGWLQAGRSDLTIANAGGLLVVFYLVALAADLVRTIMESAGAGRRPRDREAI